MQPIKPLTMRQNFSWTFAGNIIYAACQWGMVVTLAKLGSPEMVGQFTLGFAITAPLILLANMQLKSIQVTDATDQYRFGDYLGLRILTTGSSLLATLGIIIVVGYSWKTSLIIFLVALAKAIESFSDVLYGLLQKNERMDRIAISMMIKGPLSLLLLGLGLYTTGSVVWAVVGLVLAWTVVLLSYDLRSGSLILSQITSGIHTQDCPSAVLTKLRPYWRWATLARLLWLSWPLGLVMMLISLNSNIPRYFIERYLGERELGIFAAISYLMVVGNMVVSALGDAATPKLAKYYAAGETSAFRALLLKLMGIGGLLGGAAVAIALVAGQQILTLLYRPEYAEYTDIFVWLMVAAGLGYVSSFIGTAITAAQYFRIQIPLFLTVTGISGGVCFWLLPIYGLQGAVIALIVAAIARTLISLGVIFHALHKLPQLTISRSEANIG